MESLAFLGLGGVFISAFLAATLLPLSSEAVLIAVALAGEQSYFLLWLSATVGNVLGSCVNWYLGKRLARWQKARQDRTLHDQRAAKLFTRYGQWTLLLAWVPGIGDPITFIAGFFSVSLINFLLLTTLGKGGRYASLLWLLDWGVGL
ncbi:YqaA family protein [Magnetococcales bacterium HHB-1]